MIQTLRASVVLLTVFLAGPAPGHVTDDPWRSIEAGWIWEQVDAPANLAGRWQLDGLLHDGVTYEMTFEVTDVHGAIGLFLGDNPRVLIQQPGEYRYAFTANERKRMVFRAVTLRDGRARFAARAIHVRAVATDAGYRPEPPPDPWLAVEEGWIWRVVSGVEMLAGSAALSDEQLPAGYRYRMTFNVSAIEGEIALTLGDREPVLLSEPGTYAYTFTAEREKRMLFESAGFAAGRAMLAADTIRVSAELAPEPAPGSAVRVAYSADGNAHDADDWSASPLTIAMLARRQSDFELVHFDYNNHLGDSNPESAATHGAIVREAAARYGLDETRFFDAQETLQAAVASLAAAIDASSAEDRLYLICAGPMEVCWRGIDAAADSQEQFVTVISHSWWNDNHTDTAQLNHTLDDIARDFDVEIRQIPDQNATAFRSPAEEWMWLQQHGDNGQWLYERITAGGRPAHPGDASDAGMTWYVLEGSDDASMIDIRALFDR